MEEILKSDIFFFVTTIAVVVVTLAIVIVSVYAVKTLQRLSLVINEVRLKYDFIRKVIRFITK